MKTTEQMVLDFILGGGRIIVGNPRKAIGSKTFNGRYSHSVAGMGRKAFNLRLSGIAKPNHG